MLGFRTWKLDGHRGRLRAITQNTSWPVREACVSNHAHGLGACPPGRPCESSYGCGIYALESYADVESHQRGSQAFDLSLVRGAVAGWGDVVHLCTHGWRAGKAYPLALLDWENPPDRFGSDGYRWHTVLHLVAERYGIPVVPTTDELIEVARAADVLPLDEWRERS